MHNIEKLHHKNPFKVLPSMRMLQAKYGQLKYRIKQNDCKEFTIDYQNRESVRVLSEVILKESLGIKLPLPFDLAADMPFHFDYMLWLKDVAVFCKIQTKPIAMIDIEGGPACLYGVLTSKLFGWETLALQVSTHNYQYATKHLKNNDLLSSVTCKLRPLGFNLIPFDIHESSKFTFCIANPNFYNNPIFYKQTVVDSSLQKRIKVTNKAQRIAKKLTEGEIEGQFLQRFVCISRSFSRRIMIFSAVVEARGNVITIRKWLQKYCVSSFAETELFSGKIKRWGIVWTFQDIDLSQLPCNISSGGQKKKFDRQDLSYECPFKEPAILQPQIEKILKESKAQITSISSTPSSCEIHIQVDEINWLRIQRVRRKAEKSLATDRAARAALNKLTEVSCDRYSKNIDSIRVHMNSIDERTDSLEVLEHVMVDAESLCHLQKRFHNLHLYVQYLSKVASNNILCHPKINHFLAKEHEQILKSVTLKMNRFKSALESVFNTIQIAIQVFHQRIANANSLYDIKINVIERQVSQHTFQQTIDPNPRIENMSVITGNITADVNKTKIALKKERKRIKRIRRNKPEFRSNPAFRTGRYSYYHFHLKPDIFTKSIIDKRIFCGNNLQPAFRHLYRLKNYREKRCRALVQFNIVLNRTLFGSRIDCVPTDGMETVDIMGKIFAYVLNRLL